MTNVPSGTVVLAGTGKTGSRLAAKLAKLGLSVRTAARIGADVHFDWDDATTHRPVIASVTGMPMKHNDIDRDVWIQGSVAAGVPAEYGEMLQMLTETVASGMGSRPNDNVQKVTGAPPIKFADFARRNAEAWI
ncbi:hypothetical protein OG874_16165 [Nocardia sp. NBC_00565]|uniref:hypothetical protein n=1 Tax=Nocardia sp. NBC_00565 TaxID=2975993 RepID=UPI002E7FC80D|nr:hypothetical protein [Nocardia sp. NBC_00565]WUC06557.1 hypothetical protein OG874_16165 [Nocardia sp. NBC_00565]